MRSFLTLFSALMSFKRSLFLSVLFHLLTAIFTLFSIPLIIPFFQILFGISPSSFAPPESPWDLEAVLNYNFSRLIAISDRYHALAAVCIFLIVVILLRNVFRFLSSYFLIPARNGVLRDLRRDLFDSYVNMPLGLRKSTKRGQLLSLLSNDLIELDHGLLKAMELLFKVPLIIIGSLIFMFWINMKLSLIALLLAAVAVFIVGGLSRMLKRTSAKAQHLLGEINVVADEYLSGSKVIQAYTANDYFRSKADGLIENYYRLSNRILRRRDAASPISEFLAVCIIVVLLWYGAQMVFAGDILPTTFFAFVFAFYNIIDPAKSFSREYYNVKKGQAALNRIIDFKNRVHESNRLIPSGRRVIQRFREGISFENVSFRYEADQKGILKEVSLKISKGEKLGIVGFSGSGKTTLADLLLRFQQPDAGQISMDGVDISEYNMDSYRRLFGVITQDPAMFHLSIADNITFSEEAKKPDKYDQAIKSAGLRDVLLQHRDVIGDDGQILSGGGRQRVAIARALYHDPEILIMDEPTTNLDKLAENEIITAIQEAYSDRTIILISHNLLLLKGMDRIVILDEGQIIDEGSFEELTGRSGIFKDLYNTLGHRSTLS